MSNEAEFRSVISEIKQQLVEERRSKYRVRRDLIRSGYDEAQAIELVDQALLEMKEGRRYTTEEMTTRVPAVETAQSARFTHQGRDKKDGRSAPKPQEFGPSAFEKLHLFRSNQGFARFASAVLVFSTLLSITSSFVTIGSIFQISVPLLFFITQFMFVYWIYLSAVNITSFNPLSFNDEGQRLANKVFRNWFKILEEAWLTSDTELDVSASQAWHDQKVKPMRTHLNTFLLLFIFGSVFFALVGIKRFYFRRLFLYPFGFFSELYWLRVITQRQVAKYNSLVERQRS